MRKYLVIICIFLSAFNLHAQKIEVGDSTIISLITCSPGEEVYAKFGHTAIRVKDVARKYDIVFNYGIFSFDTDNFYWKFVKGDTDYQLGVSETSFFLPEYAKRNSIVWEQILNLNTQEKIKLVSSLLGNYEPENRVYRYNFIFDNCSTRPRDKIASSVNGYIRYHQTNEPSTFRHWIGEYVGSDTWVKFGIDLIFGVDADNIATQTDSQFLPEVLMSDFQNAEIVTLDGQQRKLVENRANVLIQKDSNQNLESNFLLKPLSLSFLILFIGIIVTLWDVKKKKHNKTFDSILHLMTGLAGVVAFFMMSFSSHPLVNANLNFLWLNPINVVLAILLWAKPMRRILFVYGLFNLGLLLTALVVFSLSIQSFNLASFPLIATLMIRSSHWVALTKKRIFRDGKVSIDNFFKPQLRD